MRCGCELWIKSKSNFLLLFSCLSRILKGVCCYFRDQYIITGFVKERGYVRMEEGQRVLRLEVGVEMRGAS